MTPVSHAHHASLHNPSKMADGACIRIRRYSEYKRYVWNFKECDFVPLFKTSICIPCQQSLNLPDRNNSTSRVGVQF